MSGIYGWIGRAIIIFTLLGVIFYMHKEKKSLEEKLIIVEQANIELQLDFDIYKTQNRIEREALSKRHEQALIDLEHYRKVKNYVKDSNESSHIKRFNNVINSLQFDSNESNASY